MRVRKATRMKQMPEARFRFTVTMSPARRAAAALVVAVLAMLGLAACASRGAPPPSVAVEPPALVTLQGDEVAWSSVLEANKRNVVVFMTPWCRACAAEQPAVERFARDNRRDTRVVYVVAGCDTARAAALVNQRGIELPTHVDPQGAVSDHFEVVSTPTVLVFDGSRGLQARHRGIHDVASVRLEPVTDSGSELGTSYDVVVLAADEATARRHLAEARKVVHDAEMKLSEWKQDSELSRLNRRAAIEPVEVGPELLKLISASKQVAQATGGAFDITWLPLGDLWEQSRSQSRVPTDTELREVMQSVGHDKVVVEGSTVRFTHPRTRIGLGGVGKGWIADAVFLHLHKRGYDNLVVNIGGDLRASGHGPDGPWTFNVTDPYDTTRTAGAFELDGGAVATSGNYARFTEIDGKRYGHILDPRTGMPASFDGSVTVLAPDCAMADALATAMFVMGPEQGMAWARKNPGVQVIFATRNGLLTTLPTDD